MASVLQQSLSFLSPRVATALAGRGGVGELALQGRAGVLHRDAPERLGGLPIRVEGLTKGYGARTVLHDVSLDIAQGQFVVIVGRSGSGKSTLLRAIAGLEAPDAGRVLLGNEAPQSAGRAMRMMFQDGRLLPWRRVIDNVTLGLSYNERAKAEQLLQP